MKLIPILAATVSIAAFSVPAHAVDLTFVGGHADVEGPVSTDPSLTGVNFTDMFTFTTTDAGTISGSITTHSLADPDGTIVEDLDFLSITLDGMTLANHSTGDANEEYSLASSPLSAGSHTLTVNYNIDTASAAHHAAYSGDLFLSAAAVPEPASWAMMLGGFGLIGAGFRSRNRKIGAVAA